MKKILFIAGLILFLVSCEGPQGPPGRPGVPNRVILDFEVTDWYKVTTSDGQFIGWEAYFDDVRDLTNEVYNNASIVAYKEVVNNSYKVQKMLPVVDVYQDEQGKDWFQTITFDYDISNQGAGLLFTVKNSDFRDDYPGAMWFRVVFIW